MSKMRAQTLVDKVVDIAKNHKTLYVMGCFGAPLTGENVTRYCNNHNYNKAADRTRMIKAAANQSPPVYGFDCVNLIKGVLWGWCGDPSRRYGGAAYPTKAMLAAGTCPDVGADGMISCFQGKQFLGLSRWRAPGHTFCLSPAKSLCTPLFRLAGGSTLSAVPMPTGW